MSPKSTRRACICCLSALFPERDEPPDIDVDSNTRRKKSYSIYKRYESERGAGRYLIVTGRAAPYDVGSSGLDADTIDLLAKSTSWWDKKIRSLVTCAPQVLIQALIGRGTISVSWRYSRFSQASVSTRGPSASRGSLSQLVPVEMLPWLTAQSSSDKDTWKPWACSKSMCSPWVC